MKKKVDADKLEAQVKAVLGSGQFLVIYHKAGTTSMLQGSDDMYVSYGLWRLAETMLDCQAIGIMRRAEKRMQEEAAANEPATTPLISEPDSASNENSAKDLPKA